MLSVERKINTNNSFTGYINKDLLNLVVEKLGISQLVYQPQSSKDIGSGNKKSNIQNNSEAYHPENDNKLTLQSTWNSFLPKYLGNMLGNDYSIDNFLLYKVNIKNSLLHSLLFFFDPYYRISSWERKENLIFQFKNKIVYDLDRDPKLMTKLKKENLRSNQIKNDLSKEITTPLLKQFICLYFDINLLIITEERLETFPKETDIYKSWIILYQFPYGNFAPIYFEDKSEENTKDSNKDSNNNPDLNSLTQKTNVLTPNTSPILKMLLEHLGIRDSDPDDENISKLVYNSKMTLSQLQEIAEGLGIDITKPAKRLGTFKNKTKSELIDDIDKV